MLAQPNQHTFICITHTHTQWTLSKSDSLGIDQFTWSVGFDRLDRFPTELWFKNTNLNIMWHPSSLQVANIATAGYTQTHSCLADLPSPFPHHCRWQIYQQQVTHKHTAVWLTYLHHSAITAGGKYSHSRLHTNIQLSGWLTFTIPPSLQVANIPTSGYTNIQLSGWLTFTIPS